MKRFYLTFGQKSTARNNYVVIEADNYDQARDCAFSQFGQGWSMLYSEDEFKPEYFPAGPMYGAPIRASLADTFLLAKLREAEKERDQ